MYHMKYSLLVATIGVMGLTACGQSSNQPATSTEQTEQEATVVTVSPEEFEQRMQNEPGQLIDVRTLDEYEEGHLAGSTMIDYTAPGFEQKVAELDKNQTVYVYCRSGGRSGRSAAILEEMGFTKVVDLQGGITSWMQSGRPVTED